MSNRSDTLAAEIQRTEKELNSADSKTYSMYKQSLEQFNYSVNIFFFTS